MEKSSKREMLPMMKKILTYDVELTKHFVKNVERFNPMKQLKTCHKALEISCHGVPWIACVLAFVWILNNKDLYQMQVNLLLGLILDIIFVACLKAATRRRRPAINDDPFAIGPDKYSFPSGHVSRSTLIYYFFNYLWPVPMVFSLALLVWIFAVALSRILMRRHHILDICAGFLLGYLEGLLMSMLYLESETCSNLIFWLTDEKIDGGDYHV